MAIKRKDIEIILKMRSSTMNRSYFLIIFQDEFQYFYANIFFNAILHDAQHRCIKYCIMQNTFLRIWEEKSFPSSPFQNAFKRIFLDRSLQILMVVNFKSRETNSIAISHFDAEYKNLNKQSNGNSIFLSLRFSK